AGGGGALRPGADGDRALADAERRAAGASVVRAPGLRARRLHRLRRQDAPRRARGDRAAEMAGGRAADRCARRGAARRCGGGGQGHGGAGVEVRKAGALPGRGSATRSSRPRGAAAGAAAMASAAGGAKAKPRRTRVAPKAKARRPRKVDDAAVAAIVRTLHELYPEAQTALLHENPLQLLIATILSAQSTDETVNQVTRTLFEKYRGVDDFAAADPAVFEVDIHRTGFFRNKTKSVLGAAKRLRDVYGGVVPQTMDELLTLPGVARKTANVVLGS